MGADSSDHSSLHTLHTALFLHSSALFARLAAFRLPATSHLVGLLVWMALVGSCGMAWQRAGVAWAMAGVAWHGNMVAHGERLPSVWQWCFGGMCCALCGVACDMAWHVLACWLLARAKQKRAQQKEKAWPSSGTCGCCCAGCMAGKTCVLLRVP